MANSLGEYNKEIEEIINKNIKEINTLHFDNVDNLIKTQISISNYVFIAIPTKYFNKNEALYGNERFLSYKKWRSLIKESGGTIVEEFSCQNQNFFGIIKNIRKYFRPAPIRVFVVKGDRK